MFIPKGAQTVQLIWRCSPLSWAARYEVPWVRTR